MNHYAVSTYDPETGAADQAFLSISSDTDEVSRLACFLCMFRSDGQPSIVGVTDENDRVVGYATLTDGWAPRRHLNHPVAEDNSGAYTTAWAYASHADDFEMGGITDMSIDYSSSVMDPYRPDNEDDPTWEVWYENAVLIQSLWEMAFWMARANKSDTFVDDIMAKCWRLFQATGPVAPWLSEEIVLRAIIDGSEFGRRTANMPMLDDVWQAFYQARVIPAFVPLTIERGGVVQHFYGPDNG